MVIIMLILVIMVPEHQYGCKDYHDHAMIHGNGDDIDSEADILHKKYKVPTFRQSPALPKEAHRP